MYNLIVDWDFVNSIRDTTTLAKFFHGTYVFTNWSANYFNDEWERYNASAWGFSADGLTLTASLSGALANGNVTSGMIQSKASFTYGYYECLMKIPEANGAWPAFWLYPSDGAGPAEIDIFEIPENSTGYPDSRSSYHNVHGTGISYPNIWSLVNNLGGYLLPYNVRFSGGFYKFGCLWTPTTVTHYVNDIEVVSRNYTWTNSGVQAAPANVIINLAVGGTWPGSPTTTGEFPFSATVKYLRIWQ